MIQYFNIHISISLFQNTNISISILQIQYFNFNNYIIIFIFQHSASPASSDSPDRPCQLPRTACLNARNTHKTNDNSTISLSECRKYTKKQRKINNFIISVVQDSNIHIPISIFQFRYLYQHFKVNIPIPTNTNRCFYINIPISISISILQNQYSNVYEYNSRFLYQYSNIDIYSNHSSSTFQYH